MSKITFDDFISIMSFSISNMNCIEIEFSVDNSWDYRHSWLGKVLDSKTGSEIYWFGLTEDGSQAYDYEKFEQFSNARVFDGKSIKEIWNLITIMSIDACSVEERLPFYLEH